MTTGRLKELVSAPRVIGSRILLDVLKGALPDCPGIYIVIHPEHGILYIGKAKSLKRRCKNRAWFLSLIHVAWVAIDVEEQDVVEKYLIRRYRPAYNVVHNKHR